MASDDAALDGRDGLKIFEGTRFLFQAALLGTASNGAEA